MSFKSNKSQPHELRCSNKKSFAFLGENLALGKPTLQSSVVELGVSSNAVDGNRHPDYSENSCIQTDFQIEPWWMVDLQDDFYVTSVAITNRQDCCSGRLHKFEVKVSERSM